MNANAFVTTSETPAGASDELAFAALTTVAGDGAVEWFDEACTGLSVARKYAAHAKENRQKKNNRSFPPATLAIAAAVACEP